MPKYTKDDFKDDYELLPDMDAEVIIENAEIKTAKTSNKEYISIMYRIRDDVEGQENGGRVIFESIFADKNHDGEFDRRKIGKILSTQTSDDDEELEFEDNDELVQYLNGIYLLVHINKKEADEYHTEDYNEIKYLSYKPSKFPPKKLDSSVKNEIHKATKEAEESDDELPF